MRLRDSRRFLFAVLLCAFSAADGQRRDSLLVLTHFDVGQGDATLIVTPERRRILIDAGPPGSGVAQRLKRAGIDTLDLVIASHAHADHIGGMPAVFAALVVLNYIDNGVPQTTATYRQTLAAVSSERGLKYLQATDRIVQVGSANLRILPPAAIDRSQNNNSIGVLVTFGQFSALYTGDSETGELAHWDSAGRIPRVTLVKAAHHGSWNGTTPKLFRATSPKVVVISVGAGNTYGHPSRAVLQRWAATSARVYRTDINGAIEVSALKSGVVNVRTSRQASQPGMKPQPNPQR